MLEAYVTPPPNACAGRGIAGLDSGGLGLDGNAPTSAGASAAALLAVRRNTEPDPTPTCVLERFHGAGEVPPRRGGALPPRAVRAAQARHPRVDAADRGLPPTRRGRR